MLRSILIGFAIAALLQIGVHTAAPSGDLASTMRDGSWTQLECSAAAIVRLVAQGFTVLAR